MPRINDVRDAITVANGDELTWVESGHPLDEASLAEVARFWNAAAPDAKSMRTRLEQALHALSGGGGAARIARERVRQVVEKGWTAESDDEEHTAGGELALAAVCYATPIRLLRMDERAAGPAFVDPWPWAPRYDKRCGKGQGGGGNVLPDPRTFSSDERIGLLVKAGALIAAEIDRLQRAGARALTEELRQRAAARESQEAAG